jgi:serine/threonine-protein kinase
MTACPRGERPSDATADDDDDVPTNLMRADRVVPLARRVDPPADDEVTRPSLEPADFATGAPANAGVASENAPRALPREPLGRAAPPPRVRGNMIARPPSPPLPPAPPARPPPHAPSPKPPTTRASQLIGTVVDGRYRIETVLAEGGMGVVFDAVQIDLGRRVAIKALARTLSADLDSVTRFRNEARALGSLSHPHIVEVSDYGVLANGAPYLVMERLRGETLGARLRRDGRLTIRESVRILRDMMSALAASHGQGLLHRDLKPENVFLARRDGLPPIVKLIDFGVAKQFHGREAPNGTELTRTGFVLGTYGYMAPEQARGERDLDGRADLFAAGCIAYEMLTGGLPYSTEGAEAIGSAIYECAPSPVRTVRAEVSDACARLVDALIAFDRDARPASANEVLATVTDRSFVEQLVDDDPAARAAEE